MRKYFVTRPIWVFLFILFPLFLVPHADANPGDSLDIWGPPDFAFNSPQGVAVDPDGNVYVADTGNSRILKFNSNGEQDPVFSTGTVTFSFPSGIAVGADGYVYVADTWNLKIVKFTNTGAFETEWGSCEVDGLMIPSAVAVDSDGNVYVTDIANNSIQRFAKIGGCNPQWGAAVGQLNAPLGITVDAGGSIYVADTLNARIQVFKPSGEFFGGWTIPGPGGESSGMPQGIAVDVEGNVFVTELTQSMIQVYDATWGDIAGWGSSGSGELQFNNPVGVALDQCGTRVYVADAGNNRIQILEGFGTAGGNLSVDAGEDQTIHLGCSSESVTLTATADPSGGVSYLWSGGETTQSITVSPSITTTYTVTVTGGCGKTAQDTVTVNVVPQTPPTISCPGDIFEPTDPGKCTAIVNYTVTPNDFCPGVVIVSCPGSGSEFLKGMTSVTATATDLVGNTATCSFTVTVADNEVPTITAPPAVTAYTGPGATSCGATVSDVFLGTATAIDNCPGVSVTRSGIPFGNVFPVGSTIVTYNAKDAADNIAAATQTVAVVDNTAPTITNVSANPSVLWPPNNKMVPVAVAVSVSDNCDAKLTCRIISVSSNQSEKGPGDGNHDGDHDGDHHDCIGPGNSPDWKITGNLTVDLRAERSGKGNDRVYTITVQCIDSSGNSSSKKTVTVTVPHDQGKK